MLAICAYVALTTQSKQPLYTFTHELLARGYGYRLEVRDKKQKLVWARTTNNKAATWSEDRTMLVFADAPVDPYKWGFRVVYWRIGDRLKNIRVPPLPNHFGEGIFKGGIRVSPDSRYVAFLVGATQGAFDMDLGELICVDLKTGRSTIMGGSSEKFRWTDNRTIEFYYWHFPENEKEEYRLIGPNHWNVVTDWPYFSPRAERMR